MVLVAWAGWLSEGSMVGLVGLVGLVGVNLGGRSCLREAVAPLASICLARLVVRSWRRWSIGRG